MNHAHVGDISTDEKPTLSDLLETSNQKLEELRKLMEDRKPKGITVGQVKAESPDEIADEIVKNFEKRRALADAPPRETPNREIDRRAGLLRRAAEILDGTNSNYDGYDLIAAARFLNGEDD
ncbi:hypothetical protein Bra3105_06535 [Brachybacterium halotolerans subsp. kimchii]|uniref:hypothetical protein n=1 Tax=Brachybacterium halotolerans TaxID=2795215 RepID=UPI001E2856D1|nr:hypothetical protein [Brachybacterium halotolerans]UEJ83963.1 hypothetical protein Bra3105_06535 [Brachybacterium halotolerans subsp. kimchii]